MPVFNLKPGIWNHRRWQLNTQNLTLKTFFGEQPERCTGMPGFIIALIRAKQPLA